MKLHRIPPQGRTKTLHHVVVETSRGSRNKYGYDAALGAMVLKKVLPEGHVFPFDFGFIPRTKGEDGDPLDVLVIMDEPTFAGCVVPCRIIGVLRAKQTEEGRTERNDRFIAVAESARHFQSIKDVGDLPHEVVEQIEGFFISYNEQAGKRFKPERMLGAKRARKLLKSQMK
jgi:inorganic pyrophosphatase